MFTNIERKYFLFRGKKYLYEICFNGNDKKYWIAFFADFSAFDTKKEAEEYIFKNGERLILEYLSHFPDYTGDGKGFLPMDDEERESMYLEVGEGLAKINPEEFEEMKEKLKNASISVKKPKKAISLRVNEEDILEIKKIAEREGMPYQTLISSILHKVATKQIEV